MRSSATLILILLAGPAMAAGCDRWTASMEEDEGGPRMMASICTGSGDHEHTLLVQCGADGELNLRFLPAPALGYPPNAGTGDFQAPLTFTINRESFTQKGQYEDMDGAMAMDVAIKDPLIKAMMTRETVVLSDADGKIANITFTLNRARDALDKVIGACGA